MALLLYTNTIRVVLKVDPMDENAWFRIYGSLSCLRDSLLCNVCCKLAINPFKPPSSKCQHCVCKRCVGKGIYMESQCEHCDDYRKAKANTQLRVVLQCYKKMCKYIMSSGIIRCWKGTKLTSPMMRFVSMCHEGAKLGDKYDYLNEELPGLAETPLRILSKCRFEKDGENSQSASGEGNRKRLHFLNSEPRATTIRNAFLRNIGVTDMSDSSDASSDTSELEASSIIHQCLRAVKKRKNCRCGMATKSPGKLTCCGQRCPCYVRGRACINCRCRGCRNPQKNLIASPPSHKYYSLSDTSPEYNREIDQETSDEILSSDSEKDPSV